MIFFPGIYAELIYVHVNLPIKMFISSLCSLSHESSVFLSLVFWALHGYYSLFCLLTKVLILQ